MKLYYATSVCSLAVRIIIHELAIPCEYESVNLKTKQTEMGADFLKINPKGSVPVLVLSHQVFLTENAVILQYLADEAHAVTLLPPVGEMKRYRVLEWLNFVSTDLHRYCAPIFWSKIAEDLKNNLFKPILSDKLKVVDLHLKEHLFLMGDLFTIADSYLFVILIWLAKLKFNMTAWPHLVRYFSVMKQRSAVQLALKDEGLLDLCLSE